MKKINVALIGLGQRGRPWILNKTLLKMEDVNVVAVCDIYEDRIEKALQSITAAGGNAKGYTDYKEAMNHKGLDAVVLCSPWVMHSEQALYAMEKGIPVASEVGAEYSLERCFELIRTQERTKTPYMFMENCCYGKEEVLATAVARKGLLGNIVHCSGKYSHDIREEISFGKENRHYRFDNYKYGNFDNYPTHSIGPIARLLNVNRGNSIVSVTSVSSKALGLEEYIKGLKEVPEYVKRESGITEFPEHLRKTKFSQGDVVDTLIRCSGGETIHLQLCTSLPGFYTRDFTLRGTKGSYTGLTNTFYIDGVHDSYYFDPKLVNNAKEYEEYLPDFWKNFDEDVEEHEDMDYFCFRAFFDAIKNNQKMPIDIYDAATWMAVSVLSANSIAAGGELQLMPDFTNGKWMIRKPEDVFEIK